MNPLLVVDVKDTTVSVDHLLSVLTAKRTTTLDGYWEIIGQETIHLSESFFFTNKYLMNLKARLNRAENNFTLQSNIAFLIHG